MIKQEFNKTAFKIKYRTIHARIIKKYQQDTFYNTLNIPV